MQYGNQIFGFFLERFIRILCLGETSSEWAKTGLDELSEISLRLSNESFGFLLKSQQFVQFQFCFERSQRLFCSYLKENMFNLRFYLKIRRDFVILLCINKRKILDNNNPKLARALLFSLQRNYHLLVFGLYFLSLNGTWPYPKVLWSNNVSQQLKGS